MHNIILICTRHEENGKCNSIELLKIIENIKPDVFFEELSEANFDKIYRKGFKNTLESDAIKAYTKAHEQSRLIPQVYVDTFPLPNTYEDERDLLLKRIMSGDMIPESHELRMFLTNLQELIRAWGFDFLNSDFNNQCFDEINSLKEKILEILKDENLFRVHELDKEIIAKREQEMIKNVYDISRKVEFETGLMFIGSAHRKAIMKLIEETDMHENIKLNWFYYSPKSILTEDLNDLAADSSTD